MLLMGKSTISMAMFNSFFYVYQAGHHIRPPGGCPALHWLRTRKRRRLDLRQHAESRAKRRHVAPATVLNGALVMYSPPKNGGFKPVIIGDGSKPWYLVNPKIAGKWMFIPLKCIYRYWPIPSWVSATKIWDFRDAVWDMGNLAIQPGWISKKRMGIEPNH